MKLEEKLNSIKPKELIYLFVTIPIAIFVVYYNFIYPNMEKENKKLIKSLKDKRKQLSTITAEIRDVKKSKILLKPTKEQLENLRDDFRYLKYSFNSIELIKLSNNKSYLILTKLLNKSKFLNLTTSFFIDWKQQILPFTQTINLTIKGYGNYIDIVRYIQYIENIEALLYIKNIEISMDIREKTEIKKPSDLIKNFVLQKQEEMSEISFVLTKYSDKDLNLLKHLASKFQADFYTSINHYNSDDLNVHYKANFYIIQYLKNYFKQQQKMEKLNYYDMKLKLVFPKLAKKEYQKFKINLFIVGVK